MEACGTIEAFYEAMFMGMVAGQLKGDIQNSAKTIMNVHLAHPDWTTLQTMLASEITERGIDKVRKDKKSGAIGILWAKRAIQFIMVYLNLLVTKPDATSGVSIGSFDYN